MRESALLIDVEGLARHAAARIARRRRAGGPQVESPSWVEARVRESLDALILAEIVAPGSGAVGLEVDGGGGGAEHPAGGRAGAPAVGGSSRPPGAGSVRERFVAASLGLPASLGARAARAFNGLPRRQRRLLFELVVERRPLVAGRRVVSGCEGADRVDGVERADGADGADVGSVLAEFGRALLALEAALRADAGPASPATAPGWGWRSAPAVGLVHTLAPRSDRSAADT